MTKHFQVFLMLCCIIVSKAKDFLLVVVYKPWSCLKLIKSELLLCVVSSKFQDSFGAGYTFQETLPCTNKIAEPKRFALCVSIRLNKPLKTYILSLTLDPNQAFQRALTDGRTGWGFGVLAGSGGWVSWERWAMAVSNWSIHLLVSAWWACIAAIFCSTEAFVLCPWWTSARRTSVGCQGVRRESRTGNT